MMNCKGQNSKYLQIFCLLQQPCSYHSAAKIAFVVCLLPPANEVYEKVMFLHVFVILSTGRHPHTHPMGRHPSWVDTPQADTPSGQTPTCPVHAGIHTPPAQCILDTVNKQAVRIPLECILVLELFMEEPKL